MITRMIVLDYAEDRVDYADEGGLRGQYIRGLRGLRGFERHKTPADLGGLRGWLALDYAGRGL
jgi:hypothetical protein